MKMFKYNFPGILYTMKGVFYGEYEKDKACRI